MGLLTSDQARQLSDNFYNLASAISDFRYTNWDRLEVEENKELSDMQHAVIRCGEDMLALSTKLVMNEVQDSLNQINKVSGEIKATLKDLQNIQKGLDVAASILLLGAAIIAREPEKIGQSLEGLIQVWKPTEM